jgi:poly(A) polymerase
MDALEARIDRLAQQEELKAIRPELDGNSVMELLGLRPGPDVGEAMRYLLDLRLDEGMLGEEEVTRRLTEWWSTRPISG